MKSMCIICNDVHIDWFESLHDAEAPKSWNYDLFYGSFLKQGSSKIPAGSFSGRPPKGAGESIQKLQF